jgi:hypothetical protein
VGDELPSPKEDSPLDGLNNPRALGLERFPICTRESRATLSAWRLAVSTDDGEGSIFLVEISPDRAMYRGEGIFLGWPQSRLEAAYSALVPRPNAPDLELQQLG